MYRQHLKTLREKHQIELKIMLEPFSQFACRVQLMKMIMNKARQFEDSSG